MILSLSTLGTATAFCTNLGVLAFDCFMMKHLFTVIFEAMERYFANMVAFPFLSLWFMYSAETSNIQTENLEKNISG
jgi:hypothetical protein